MKQSGTWTGTARQPASIVLVPEEVAEISGTDTRENYEKKNEFLGEKFKHRQQTLSFLINHEQNRNTIWTV